MAVGTLVVIVLARLPASQVISQVPLPKGMVLSGVTGTAWEGQALSASWHGHNLGKVSWSLLYSKALRGRAEYRLTFGDNNFSGLHGHSQVGFGLGGWSINDLSVSMPAGLVSNIASLPVPAFGQIEVAMNDALYSNARCEQGQGQLHWRDGSVSFDNGPLSLGNTTATLTCEGGAVAVIGEQNGRQVTSEFSFHLAADQSYQTQLLMKLRASFPSDLARQLRRMAKRDGQGRYQLSFGGRL
ncbi:type II secretion system protein N [Sansalvadorimonas verongulae]|uniref:type II secretion system protein N n=1 Tax=Sansalvadorimonas verongulae TaxID=2172824 RepID=UPI0018AD1CA3|nr:type II secretion system protein N [Sansalvadorimonas verongulae]